MRKSLFVLAVVAVICMGFSSPSNAGENISQEDAQKMMTQAGDIAKKNFAGRPITIAVCDASGVLVGFTRMDGVPLRTIYIAQQKAYTAVFMASTTGAFGLRLKNENLQASDFCDPKNSLTAIDGGAPIKNSKGVTIGGLAVSGLKAEEDAAIVAEVLSTFGK